MGCVQRTHFCLRAGPYSACFLGFPVFSRRGMSFESHHGHSVVAGQSLFGFLVLTKLHISGFRVWSGTFVEAEEAELLDVSVDTLEDLTSIEQLIDQTLAPLHGPIRRMTARLRQAPLLLEGHVVPFAVFPLKATAGRGGDPSSRYECSRVLRPGRRRYRFLGLQ